MKLLLILWWGAAPLLGFDLAGCLAMAATKAAETQNQVVDGQCLVVAPGAEDDSCQIIDTSPRKSKAATGNVTAVCFVRGTQGACIPWRGKVIHEGACQSAARCHIRQLKLLPADAKAKDTQLLKENPEAYSANVSQLMVVAGAVRSQSALDSHREGLMKSFYSDSYTEKQRLLLTKRRFIAFQKQWEGCDSSEASYSFDRRLDEQSTANEDSEDGLPQVPVRNNTAIGIRTGSLATLEKQKGKLAGNGNERSGGDRRRRRRSSAAESRGEGGGGGRRGRRRGGAGRESRSRSRRGRTSGSSRQAASNSSTLTAKQEPLQLPERPRDAGAGSRRMTAKRTPWQVGGSRSRGSASGRAKPGEFEASEVPTGGEPAQTPELTFLKNKKAFKKELDTTIMKTETKTWIGTDLAKRWADLDPGAQAVLLKQGNHDQVQLQMKTKVTSLKNLRQELLSAVDASSVEDWIARRNQTMSEYEAACIKAETFMEQVKELRSQNVEVLRIQKAAESYQKKKLAGLLEHGGFGNQFSKAVAELLRTESAVVVVREPGQVAWSEPMIFEPTADIGAKLGKGLDDYMRCSTSTVASKVKAVQVYLTDNPSKFGAMSIVPNGAAVPGLQEACGLPDKEMLSGEEGTAPWIAGAKPFRFRFGPNMFPMPGIGCFIRKVTDVGLSMVVIPVSALVKAGMVVLAELPAMLNTEAGCKVFKEHAKAFTWLGSDAFSVWIPYGWLPLQVSNDSESDPSFVWSLPVISEAMVKPVPKEVWSPVLRLVQDHNQKLSGESIWAHRKHIIDNLVEKRGDI